MQNLKDCKALPSETFFSETLPAIQRKTHARSFPFCIRAALLICQSEAVASSKRKKGQGGGGAASSGKARSQNHPGVCELLCAAQLGLGAIAV